MASAKRRPAAAAAPPAGPDPGEPDLIVVGAGAAGLMAAASAGELGLRCVVLERRHRPGLKLLLCGNNRCNVTREASAEGLLSAYGEPVAPFLAEAVTAFPPSALRAWFQKNGLRTTVHSDGRVFPASEKADDVVHCFRDALRGNEVPLVLNCPVLGVEREPQGYRVRSTHFSLVAPRVLLATGGVSYPKTGSVGDGQRFARSLGHRVTPYRPGLAGVELESRWLGHRQELSLPDAEVAIWSQGREVARTRGEILLDRTCARGPAMVNASRVIARCQLRDVEFVIDLFPKEGVSQLAGRLLKGARGKRDVTSVLRGVLPMEVARELVRDLPVAAGEEEVAQGLKNWRLRVRGVRPLKEAMVTVGGVQLADIDPATMESRRSPGLYFAGEVMDVDGPTGGYNLHAAFATARLVVSLIARGLGREARPSRAAARAQPPRRGRGRR